MASKSLLGSLPFILLLLLLQTLPSFQLFVIPSGPRDEYRKTFAPSETKAIVDVDMIAKALWNSGYKIMSLILEKNLHSIVPYGDYRYDPKNSVTIYNNNTITVFAPRDEAVRFENWNLLEYQVVTSKVDKEAFNSGFISKGSELHTCDLYRNLVISEVPDSGYPSINNVKITQWDIYNDGHVIVHGVEDFFNYRFELDHPSKIRESFAVAEM